MGLPPQKINVIVGFITASNGDNWITPRILWSVWGTLFLRVTLQIKAHPEETPSFEGL